MEPALTGALKFLREAGLLGVLMLILFGGFKRWWIFGWQLDRVVAHFEKELEARTAERDDWKRMAMGQTAIVGYTGAERRAYTGPERRRRRDEAPDGGAAKESA